MPLGIAEIAGADALLLGREGAVIGRHHLQRAGLQSCPQAVLMRLGAEGRRHHAPCGVVPVAVVVFAGIEHKMLDQRLAIDALAGGPGAGDRFMGFTATGVNDIERCAGHVGDHDGAIGGLAFHLGRA